MTWIEWVGAMTSLAVVVGGVAYAVGFLFGRSKVRAVEKHDREHWN